MKKETRDKIHELAKLIKSIGTIIGAITAVVVFILQLFPESPIGQATGELADKVTNRQSRGVEGYLYYEVGEGGGLTGDGQLLVAGYSDGGLPDFKGLKEGDVLIAASQVFFRAGPTSSSDYIQIYGKGQRFVIKALDSEVETSEARSGGWLRVEAEQGVDPNA